MKLTTRYAIAMVIALVGLPLLAFMAQAAPVIFGSAVSLGSLYASACGSVLSVNSLGLTFDRICDALALWSGGSLLFWSVVGGFLLIGAVHADAEQESAFLNAVKARWFAEIMEKHGSEAVQAYVAIYRKMEGMARGAEQAALSDQARKQFALLSSAAVGVPSTFWHTRYQIVAFVGALLFSFGSPATGVIGALLMAVVLGWALLDPNCKFEMGMGWLANESEARRR